MQMMQPSAVPAAPATRPLCTGAVRRQPMLTPERRQHVHGGIVHVPAGVHKKMPPSSRAQGLCVTAGTGMIATATEEKAITVGEVVPVVF